LTIYAPHKNGKREVGQDPNTFSSFNEPPVPPFKTARGDNSTKEKRELGIRCGIFKKKKKRT